MRFLVLLAFAATASAQEPGGQYASAERGPRFLFATVHETVAVDVARTPALRRRVSIDATGQPLKGVLDEIARQAGLSLSFSPDVVNLERRVTFEAKNLTVAAALTEVLMDLRVDVVLSPSGQLSIVRQPAPPAVGTITGTVTDALAGNPVPQAEVRVSGTSLSAATQADGRYTIVGVPAGQRTVTVRRLGYNPMSREVAVRDGESVTVDFALNPRPTTLSEIVTTVTGGEERYKLGNAISRIQADSVMRQAPIRSFQDLLAGRAPGLQILNANGLSGTSNAIRVRGVNSFTVGNDPLIVIDGVRAENTSQNLVFNGVVGSNLGTPGRMADLNPDEIESIEIVKGPSAATLYGTDAANGVIVVTTKRGRAGRPQWTVAAEYGLVSNQTTFPEGYYAFGRNTATGAPVRCTTVNQAAGLCTVDSLSRFTPLNDPALTPFASGVRNDINVQVSGGSETLRYFVAGGYETETGYLKMPEIDQQLIRRTRGITKVAEEQVRPNAFDRHSLRGNFTARVGPNAEFTLSSGYISTDTRLPGGSQQVIRQGIFSIGYRDALNDGWTTRPAYTFALRNREAANRATVSANTVWRLTPWLTTRATAGVDNTTALFDYLLRAGEGRPGTPGARLNSQTNILLTSVDLGMTASLRPASSVTSRTSAGVQYNRRNSRGATVAANGLPVGSETVAGAVNTQATEFTVETIVAGAYLEQEFGWRERLFVTGAARFDGGSAFGTDFNTVVYPKASVSWLAVGAGGERRGPVSLFRLRGAFGQSGVQPDPVAALARYDLFTTISGSGTGILSFGNPLLKPERQVEFEAGLDAELWDQRVRLEATAYHRQSKDALVNRPLGPSLAVATVQENIGSVRNRGLEGGVTVRAIESRSATLDVGLNGFVNQNRLLKLGAGVQPVGASQQRTRQTEGYPLYGGWARPILGFADANGNGILEPTEVQVGDTAVYMGSPTPTRQVTGTLTLGLLNERLRLSSLLDYRGGHTIYDSDGATACATFLQVCPALNDPTTPLAQQAAMIAQNFHGGAIGGYYADASFLRWREVAVSYVLPPVFLRRMRTNAATLTLAGRNLGLITGFPGLDPEAVGISAVDEPATAALPPATYWIARLTLGF